MKKCLTQKIAVSTYHIINGERIEGPHKNIRGDVSDIRGDVDTAELTEADRAAGVSIDALII